MTLLISLLAAVVSTVLWYCTAGTERPKHDMKISVLCWMYWGASLMWMVDAVFAYAEDHEAFFRPSGAEMLNDLYLGLSVVVLGLVIWLLVLLIRDPKGVVRNVLSKRS